ncbi:MAG TPA: AsmA family protein [Hyphomicrobium sp.]|nr:AsmA family protein [Hyphomicrobium sp.]
MNNALLYLGGLLIAALALLFAAPRFIDWNSYRGVFEEEASRILGREVRVGGAVNLSLLPAPYVSFERLRIADTSDEGASSIIRVESFTMRLSVPPLLKGLIEAHRVELRRPVLNLVINEAGGGNWQSLTFAPGALPFVPKDVALQSVEIEDGAIIVNTAGHRELARFDAINGEFTAEALEGPFKYRGTVNWQNAPRQVRIATAQIDPNGDLRFKAAVDVTDSKNAYMLDGRLRDLKGAPSLDGALTARLALVRDPVRGASAPPSSARPSNAETPDIAEPLDFEFDGEGATEPATPPSSALAPDASAQGPRSVELKSKVHGTTSGVALQEIAISLEAGATPQLIEGEARLDWAETMRLDVALSSRWINLDQIAEVTTKEMPLEAGRTYFEALASALPAEADTNARLEFDQVTLGGEPIGNVRLAARRAGGPLELDAVRADLPGGVRLELDGILTPTQNVPRLDGSLFVSGKSLMRFLAWGLDNPDVGRERTDGPFSLDGKFALGDGTLALSNAALEFAGTPLTGEIKLDLGERRKIALAMEGPRMDVAQLGSGGMNLARLRHLLMGETAEGEAANAAVAPSSGATETEGADFSIDVKLAELVDGQRILRDVDAVVQLDKGTLSIPRLKFSTPEGLLVEAAGGAKEVPARPQGTLRGLIAAPNPRAARAFLDLVDGEDSAFGQDFDRIAGLAPLRLAWTLDLAGGDTQAIKLSLDGTLAGGRAAATLGLDRGRGQWRTQPLDFKANLENPNIARLAATLLGVDIASDAAERSGNGRAVIKAAGVPSEGLLTLADVTATGLVLGYRGEIGLKTPGDRRLDGELRIRAADVRVPLALAGLDVASGVDGTPLAGTVKLHREANRLDLSGQGLRLGDSIVSGQAAVVPGADGRETLTATLSADKASIAALLAPITRKAETAPEGTSEAETIGAASIIWPDQPFDVSPLGHLDGKITATVGALTLEPGLTISDATLDIALAQDAIKIARLEGGAVGGRLQSSFDIERAPAGIDVKGSLSIAIGDDGDKTAGEAVQFSADFAGRAFSPAAVVATLSGKGELTVGDATLNGNSPAAVSTVARAALTGQGPAGGEEFAQAIADALKDGEVQLGKLTIPAHIEDGALRLDRVRIDMAEGRSTFATVVELATMRMDSEWQIEPKLEDVSQGAAQQAALPPVTVVYTGKLSQLDALAPVVSAGALERELVVRKMEFDVGELERLRKLDEERARKDAERRRALEAERARQEAERQRLLEEERAREEARRALEEDTLLSDPNAWEPDPQYLDPGASVGVPGAAGNGVANPNAAAGVPQGADPQQAMPAPTSHRPPPRRRKRAVDEEWRPFQSSPF